MAQHFLDTDLTTSVESSRQPSPFVPSIVKKQKIKRQQNNKKRLNNNSHHSVHISDANSLELSSTLKDMGITGDNSIKFEGIPDEIFLKMLSTAFDSTGMLDPFMNQKEKIEFVRHYTALIDRLSYLKLQQIQLNWYYHIGITQHIWMGRISKHAAEKNSICHTYGRSKTLVEQGCKNIQIKLAQVQQTIQLFEEQIAKRTAEYGNCSTELNRLSSVVDIFVREHHQKFINEFEFKRETLILDAVDRRLVEAFFNLKPDKSQVRTVFL